MQVCRSRGFNPEEPPQGIGSAVKWIIGGKLLYELRDEYDNYKKNQLRRDTLITPYFIPYRP